MFSYSKYIFVGFGQDDIIIIGNKLKKVCCDIGERDLENRHWQSHHITSDAGKGMLKGRCNEENIKGDEKLEWC